MYTFSLLDCDFTGQGMRIKRQEFFFMALVSITAMSAHCKKMICNHNIFSFVKSTWIIYVVQIT